MSCGDGHSLAGARSRRRFFGAIGRSIYESTPDRLTPRGDLSNFSTVRWAKSLSGHSLMSEPIDRRHFKEFCRSRSGQRFETLYMLSPFTMVVPSSGEFRIEFLPETASPPRIDSYLAEYVRKGGSLHTKDYTSTIYPIIAAKMVTLFSKYLDHLPCSRC